MIIKQPYADERFTSKMTFQGMIGNGKKEQRQNKALIGEIYPMLVLQDYLTPKRI